MSLFLIIVICICVAIAWALFGALFEMSARQDEESGKRIVLSEYRFDEWSINEFASGGVERSRPLTNGHQQPQTPSLRVTKAEAPKSDSRHTGTESGSIVAGVAPGPLAESFSEVAEP